MFDQCPPNSGLQHAVNLQLHDKTCFECSMYSIISPAILRTVLSAVSSCRTERGCPTCQAANPARSNSITTPPRPHRKSSLPLLDCELDASMRGVLLGVGCGCDWAGRGGERPAQCRAATAPHRRTYTPAILSPVLATPPEVTGICQTYANASWDAILLVLSSSLCVVCNQTGSH